MIRPCTTMGHEDVPADFIGVYDDGYHVNPDVAYCRPCAAVMDGIYRIVTTVTLPVQSTYQQGYERGIRQGVGQAVDLLIHAGVPPAHHEVLHEWIDAWEIEHGDLKRQPRSAKYKIADPEWIPCCDHCGCLTQLEGHDDSCRYGCNDDTS